MPSISEETLFNVLGEGNSCITIDGDIFTAQLASDFKNIKAAHGCHRRSEMIG